MNENPYVGQEPKALFKILKSDVTLTPDQVEQIFVAAFPEPDEIDFEDENMAKMHGQIQTARKAAAERVQAARAAEILAQREIARKYLIEQGVDPSVLPEEVLDEVAHSLVLQAAHEQAPEENEPVVAVQRDEDTMTLVTSSGVVLGFIDAPHADLDRKNILEWVGERLAYCQARQKGLAAEKQAWLDKINRIYDPQINKQSRVQKGINYVYGPMGQLYLDDVRAEAVKKGLKTIPKSMKIGLLTLAYAKDRSRVDIISGEKAIEWAEAECPDAVKVVKSVGVSLIPDALKSTLTEEQKAITGIYFYPGGTEQFSMK